MRFRREISLNSLTPALQVHYTFITTCLILKKLVYETLQWSFDQISEIKSKNRLVDIHTCSKSDNIHDFKPWMGNFAVSSLLKRHRAIRAHTLSGQDFKKVEDIWNCIDELISSKHESLIYPSVHSLPDKRQKVIESDTFSLKTNSVYHFTQVRINAKARKGHEQIHHFNIRSIGSLKYRIQPRLIDNTDVLLCLCDT